MSENKGILVKKQVLREADLSEIQSLADLCNGYENLNMKLEFEMLRSRDANQTNDFLYYQDNALVGFLGLYGMGSGVELTGMVQPEFRRTGIASALLIQAIQECKNRGTAELLLVCERASTSGTAFAKTKGAYSFSEYHMEMDTPIPTPAVTSQLQLELANLADLEILSHIQMLSFKDTDEEAHAQIMRDLSEEGRNTYLTKLEGVPIGKIGAQSEENDTYIFGVSILPEYQGRGYGRQMLAALLQKLRAEGHTRFSLDVQTENQNALSLYQTCGFQETNIYDYYEVLL